MSQPSRGSKEQVTYFLAIQSFNLITPIKAVFESQEVKRLRGQGEYVEISNRFVALEDLNAVEEINGAWETRV
jgi:hypothetical protein